MGNICFTASSVTLTYCGRSWNGTLNRAAERRLHQTPYTIDHRRQGIFPSRLAGPSVCETTLFYKENIKRDAERQRGSGRECEREKERERGKEWERQTERERKTECVHVVWNQSRPEESQGGPHKLLSWTTHTRRHTHTHAPPKHRQSYTNTYPQIGTSQTNIHTHTHTRNVTISSFRDSKSCP